MDKKYQDILYEKMVFNSNFNEVVWMVREVHIIAMSFTKIDIRILYKDTNGKYHTKSLMKKRLHRLVIE